MLVYRLSQKKYSEDLTGKGAELFGGRWNNMGTPMLYTSENRALCLVEIAVHTPYGLLPENYELVTISLPVESINSIPINDLPKNWDSVIHQTETQNIGDKFITDHQFLALKVPSAVVKQEYNILINPRHELMKEVYVLRSEPFEFDSRLFINS